MDGYLSMELEFPMKDIVHHLQTARALYFQQSVREKNPSQDADYKCGWLKLSPIWAW